MDGGGGGSDVLGSSMAPLTWHDFLERMRHPSAAEFVKSIKSFIVSFSNEAPDPEKDSTAVQDFLANMEAAFRGHMLWAGSLEEELESAGEGLEKYIMTKLFNRAFASLPEDVKRDDEIYEKALLLQQFVRPENLDIKPNYRNEAAWLLAQKELQKINMYKAPRDKLVCILNCCKVINNLLVNASLASNDNPPGADDFLPVLIYVTIKANPPQLHSNLVYIERYRRRSRLVSEAAYFFTNIVSVESFIGDISAQSLSMDEAEFQRKMDSSRAHLLPSLSNSENPTVTDNMADATLGTKRDIAGHLPPRDHHSSVPQPQPNRTTAREFTAADSEKKGAAELLEDSQTDRYFEEYPFLYSHAGDLTIGEVESLLNSYKRLVFRYVCLAKGMGAIDSSSSVPNSNKQSGTVAEEMDSDEKPGDDDGMPDEKLSSSLLSPGLDVSESGTSVDENLLAQLALQANVVQDAA